MQRGACPCCLPAARSTAALRPTPCTAHALAPPPQIIKTACLVPRACHPHPLQELITSFLATFQGAARWIEATKAGARATGGVCTLAGRRRPLPGLASADKKCVRWAGAPMPDGIASGAPDGRMRAAKNRMLAPTHHHSSGCVPRRSHDVCVRRVCTSASTHICRPPLLAQGARRGGASRCQHHRPGLCGRPDESGDAVLVSGQAWASRLADSGRRFPRSVFFFFGAGGGGSEVQTGDSVEQACGNSYSHTSPYHGRHPCAGPVGSRRPAVRPCASWHR